MSPHSTKNSKSNDGFTLIEVLIAMLIFVISALVFIDLTRGASRATRDTKEISVATWLLQGVMTELETKLETEGFDKACEKKKTGKFEPPYQNYSWVAFCKEIDFKVSQTATAMDDKDEDSNEPKKENMILKLILNTASDYLTKSIREIHAEVVWTSGKRKRSVDATTHVARYDQPLSLPAISLGGGL